MQKKGQKRIYRPKHVLSVKQGTTLVTYDKEADAAYFKIRKGSVAKTLEIQKWILADVDKKGVLLGIEMLFVSSQIPRKNIVETMRAGKVLVAA